MSCNIVLISASPKVNQESASKFIISMLENRIGNADVSKANIDVRESFSKNTVKQAYEVMSKADAVVFAFPLYFFCLPGILMRFLEDYYHYYLENVEAAHKPKIYAIVNCGFSESGINSEAVRVVKSFSNHINAEFRFGILIGGGGALVGAKDAPFMKKTMSLFENSLDKIINDIIGDDHQECENIEITVNIPRWLYMFMAGKGFTMTGRKNGLKKKELYRKTYRMGEK